ncbi:hypothetical protein JV173_01990 [Acholeplasma equirhinis]|uniref:alpha-amylase family glycosyl hydrolase n=1 Tax=Acholeplasma equirhinis TaxID=555393 RepID=UPI00197A85B1|nr:alpha-amylase family glycosyl hydrolase [Acholeplasma equirhinis]MBN3490276.1 hypothetical protein [Acholeplasma equirhinis]
MKAFIDDFNLVRIESKEYIWSIGIESYQLYWSKNEDGNQYFKVDKPLNLQKVDHIWINEVKYPLGIGVVTLLKSFDKKFRYDGPLGVNYQKSYTEFFVFSPVAKEMFVVIDGIPYEMSYEEPVWTAKVEGDLEGKPYVYRVRLVDQFADVKDPYTVAANLTDSIIIDPAKLNKQIFDYVPLKKYTDAVIYEGHVRDMTIHLDVIDKGLFDGLSQPAPSLGTSVLGYIKNLGITHLQLLPVFDFYGVDDINKEKAYNWGYNPMQYFAVEGWYSKDPNDPYMRINEFRNLVDEAHKLNLGIVMDVVYNHVYERALFPYDQLVPGYFFRHDRHFQPTHSCYLENDVETTNYMVRRLIIDSLVHFVKNYKVDGFRFDLMGLMDVDTLNQAEMILRKINPSIILYGEGWNMDSAINKNLRSNMNNQHLMPKIGHFNDFYRNLFKGPLHTTQLGYATGSKHDFEKVLLGLTGSSHMFNLPTKSLNYVECHDNMTFFDTLAFNYKDEVKKKMYQDFVNHLIAISIGVPFYHAGQEMYRTKFGEENSYQSSDDINAIRWYDYSSISKFKKILRLRKKYKLYRMDKYPKKEVQTAILEDYIYYALKGDGYILEHYLKNDFKSSTLKVDGDLIFNSQRVKKDNGLLILDKPGVYIVRKKLGKKS